MPAVHHLAVRGKNDGMRQISLVDQLDVSCQLAPRQTRASAAANRLIQLSNRLERYALARQTSRQFAETVDVPREKSTLGFTKEVLLAQDSQRSTIPDA